MSQISFLPSIFLFLSPLSRLTVSVSRFLFLFNVCMSFLGTVLPLLIIIIIITIIIAKPLNPVDSWTKDQNV